MTAYDEPIVVCNTARGTTTRTVTPDATSGLDVYISDDGHDLVIDASGLAGAGVGAAADENLGNNIVDDGSGNLTIEALGVTTAQIAASAVTEAKNRTY